VTAPAAPLPSPEDPELHAAHIGIFDFTGAFREKRLDADGFRKALNHGWHFIDALPYWMHDETCFVERGFVDEPVALDATAIRPYPFEPNACLAIADYAGPSAAISPRATLKRLIAKADSLGFEPIGGFEYETIFLDEDGESLRAKDWRDAAPALTENRCWSGVAPAADNGFLLEVHETIRAAGISLDHHCMELGPGCVEYTLGPDPFLKATDDAALFKTFTKAIARSNGLTACFLAQLDDGFPGLCGHINLSLRKKDGAPTFHDANDPHHLSEIGRAFLGGIVALTPELMCMFAPTVNAYRRLRPGNWAPRAANWGIGNYSCGVRVVTHSPEETRFEFRLPGADIAPHTAAAMMLGAGLWGIETNANPGKPVEGNGRLADVPAERSLPLSLEEAAKRFARSTAARELFGGSFVDHYAARCAAEAAAFHAHVSAFERARYLETC
jgi:glutamine synthetase